MKQYRHAFRFLFVFLGLYLVLNFFYAGWISSLGNVPDRATVAVTHQTSYLLNALGEETFIRNNPGGPTVRLMEGADIVLNVFEGCNGLNVVIVFIAFLSAFGGRWKALVWFLPLGLLAIHAANLIRIGLLFWVAKYYNTYFYYVHKYLFTAAIYLVVFALWWIWIEKVNRISLRKSVAS